MFRTTTLTLVAVVIGNAAVAQSTSEAELRDLTLGVLSSIAGTPPPEAPAEAAGEEGLKSLVQQALEEGQSDAYLEALVSEAAVEGRIEVPDEMRTTEGEVDTATLLASLVSQSLSGEEEGAAEAAPAEDLEDEFYTVASGDSLAAIALQYYGDAQQYERIFEANRETIRRPNLIRVGQVITIPR